MSNGCVDAPYDKLSKTIYIYIYIYIVLDSFPNVALATESSFVPITLTTTVHERNNNYNSTRVNVCKHV